MGGGQFEPNGFNTEKQRPASSKLFELYAHESPFLDLDLI